MTELILSMNWRKFIIFLLKKNINNEDIIKLTNLAENHSISELVDQCLSKNRKKTLNIINENNSSQEDNILIIKLFF